MGRKKRKNPPEWDESKRNGVVCGEEAFYMYSTHGLPIEMLAKIAGEAGLTVDMDGFNAAMERAREKSRAGSKFKKGEWYKKDEDDEVE